MPTGVRHPSVGLLMRVGVPQVSLTPIGVPLGVSSQYGVPLVCVTPLCPPEGVTQSVLVSHQ